MPIIEPGFGLITGVNGMNTPHWGNKPMSDQSSSGNRTRENNRGVNRGLTVAWPGGADTIAIRSNPFAKTPRRRAQLGRGLRLFP